MVEFQTIKFLAQQYTVGFPIFDEPHFDPDSTPYFLERLTASKRYLEYGAGGSTVQAARMGKTFCTIESDKHFLRKIGERIGKAPSGTLLHANIGLTQRWGWPVMTTPTPARIKRWRGYAMLPWVKMPDYNPDLVLIDGRFRILCALTSIDHLRGDWEMLFDDYADRRADYGIVEKYAELTGFAGRMAIFKRKDFDLDALKMETLKHVTDFS